MELCSRTHHTAHGLFFADIPHLHTLERIRRQFRIAGGSSSFTVRMTEREREREREKATGFFPGTLNYRVYVQEVKLMKRQRKKKRHFRFMKALDREEIIDAFPTSLSFPGSAVIICSMQTSYPTSYPPIVASQPTLGFSRNPPLPIFYMSFLLWCPTDPVCVCVCPPPPKISFLLPIVAHKRMTSSSYMCAPDVWRVEELSIAIILSVVIAIHKYKMKGMMMKNKTKKREKKYTQTISLSRVF